jgi:hypothetical protein
MAGAAMLRTWQQQELSQITLSNGGLEAGHVPHLTQSVINLAAGDGIATSQLWHLSLPKVLQLHISGKLILLFLPLPPFNFVRFK